MESVSRVANPADPLRYFPAGMVPSVSGMSSVGRLWGIVAIFVLFPAIAAGSEKPLIRPLPDWVVPVSIVDHAKDGSSAATATLLQHVETQFDHGESRYFAEYATKILTNDGLDDEGTFIANWKPDTEDIIVHKLEIIRNGHVLDAMGDGRKLTVLRREKNLETASIDGSLTITLSFDGLQVGDIVHTAYTVVNRDPVLRGHKLAYFSIARPGRIDHVVYRATWTGDPPLRARIAPDLEGKVQTSDRVISFDKYDVQAALKPNKSPDRFGFLGDVQLSDFRSWEEVSSLFWPLYEQAEKLDANSPIQDEIRKIKASTSDRKGQALAALKVVQDQIRYLFIGLNNGGYVPAPAELTWKRRFGDCKGKTALLLALLHGLGIEADPVLVDTEGDDGFNQFIPTSDFFDHILVRARIDGREYWLDGTRAGDYQLDRPEFDIKWALELKPAGGALVSPPPPKLTEPTFVSEVEYYVQDALDKPANVHAEHRFTGEEGISKGLEYSGLSEEQRERKLRLYWRKQINSFTPTQTVFFYNKANGVTILAVNGTADVDWAESSLTGTKDFVIGDSAIGSVLDLHRELGPGSDAPYSVDYPYDKSWTVKVHLPKDKTEFFLINGASIDKVVAGTRYRRTADMDASGLATITTHIQTLAPEYPFKEGAEASKKLRELADYDVTIAAVANAKASEPVGQLRKTLHDAIAAVHRTGASDEHLKMFKSIFSDPAYKDLNDTEKANVQANLVWLGPLQNDYAVALAASRQRTAGDGVTPLTLVEQISFERRLEDFEAEGLDIIRLSQLFPASLSRVDDNWIFDLARRLKKDARYNLISALREARWRPDDPATSPDSLWRMLATEMIARGDLTGASKVVGDIVDPRDLTMMSADKRFDKIAIGLPKPLHVPDAVEGLLKKRRENLKRHPDQIAPINEYARSLITAGRFTEALEAIDAALDKAKFRNGQARLFGDYSTEYSDLLMHRAEALFALGRWDDAISSSSHALRYQGTSGRSVKALFDLAEDYIALERPKDALDVFEDYDPSYVTAFGRARAHLILACAHEQTGDVASRNRALSYLEANAQDSINASVTAELCANREDMAARLLISALRNEETRSSALLSVQTGPKPPTSTPRDVEMQTRRARLLSRADVAGAIAAVGRVLAYSYK